MFSSVTALSLLVILLGPGVYAIDVVQVGAVPEKGNNLLLIT